MDEYKFEDKCWEAFWWCFGGAATFLNFTVLPLGVLYCKFVTGFIPSLTTVMLWMGGLTLIAIFYAREHISDIIFPVNPGMALHEAIKKGRDRMLWGNVFGIAFATCFVFGFVLSRMFPADNVPTKTPRVWLDALLFPVAVAVVSVFDIGKWFKMPNKCKVLQTLIKDCAVRVWRALVRSGAYVALACFGWALPDDDAPEEEVSRSRLADFIALVRWWMFMIGAILAGEPKKD